MYHSICDNPKDPHAVPPQVFENQMHSLQSARVISLSEGLQCLKENKSLKSLVVLTFDDAYEDFYLSALPILKKYDLPATVFVPTGLVGKTAEWDTFDKSKRLMTWEQLEACQPWRVTFGSHTVTHVRLTECTQKKMEAELRESIQTLQRKLKSVAAAIAYPGGYIDERISLAAREAGYGCGLGAASRWGNGPETHLFRLRRERFTA